MKWQLLLLAIILAPLAAAQSSHNVDYYNAEIAGTALLVSAGQSQLYFSYPDIVAREDSVFFVSVDITGPVGLAAIIPTVVQAFPVSSGCTVAVGASGTTGLAQLQYRSYLRVTMTSPNCSAVVSYIVMYAAVAQVQYYAAINTHVESTSMNVTNSGNVNGNQTLSGTVATVVSGNLTVADDANGWSVNVASWPSLNVNVSGNLTVADDANGWATTIQAWPTLFSQTNITSWPALVAAISGNLTVSDDANGWATTIQAWPTLFSQTNITSWPALVAALSGNLTVFDDANGWQNHIEGNLSLSGELDTNTTVNIDTFDISNGTFNQTNLVPEIITIRNSGTDFYLPIFLWAFALFVFLRIAKLMAAVAATIGFMGSLATNLPEFQAIALVLLGIALWLEATARDQIYARWFKGNTKGERA